MSDCSSIDGLVTPYVDGELGSAERQALEQHAAVCPPCQARVNTERAVRALMQEQRSALCREQAPSFLRARCTSLAAATPPAPSDWIPDSSATPATGRWLSAPAWRRRLAPVAAAASLIVIVGGAFLYQATERSSQILAAQLAADHVKCFAMNAVLGTHQTAAIVEGSMASSFGWDAHLPDAAGSEGLELVGSRPCLYGEGKVAHIMYRHQGRPVSLFMLPRTERSEQLVQIFGHECAIWSAGDRTFVLVAREPRADVERLAAFVHATLR